MSTHKETHTSFWLPTFVRMTFLAILAHTFPLCAHKTAKQELIVFAKEIEAPLWRTTAPLHTPFPTLLPTPHMPQLRFCSEHRTSMTKLGKYITFAPLRAFAVEELTKVKMPSSAEDFFDGMVPHARALSVTEHIASARLAHTFVDGNWTLHVDGGVGASMRHFWLADPHRAAVLDTLQTFKQKKEKKRSLLPRSNRGPQLPLTPWHAQGSTTGFHDTLCTLSYQFKSDTLGKLATGIQLALPTGTLAASRVTDDDSELPLAAHPFALRCTNRVRDMLVVPPLGTGHWGVGATCQFTLPLGSRWEVISGINALQYLPAEESRYTLDIHDSSVPFLFEGISGTEVGISPDDDVTQYIRQHLYPTKKITTVLPGTLLQGQAGLSYRSSKWQFSVLYRGSWQGNEYSTHKTALRGRQHHSIECGFIHHLNKPGLGSWQLQLSLPLSRAGDGYYWGFSVGFRE